MLKSIVFLKKLLPSFDFLKKQCCRLSVSWRNCYHLSISWRINAALFRFPEGSVLPSIVFLKKLLPSFDFLKKQCCHRLLKGSMLPSFDFLKKQCCHLSSSWRINAAIFRLPEETLLKSRFPEETMTPSIVLLKERTILWFLSKFWARLIWICHRLCKAISLIGGNYKHIINY